MKIETVQKILQQTKDNYNAISEGWDQTRQNLWQGFDDFLPYIKSGDKVLDVGCGNGRLVKLFNNVNNPTRRHQRYSGLTRRSPELVEGRRRVNVSYTGVDNSQNLLNIAKKNFPEHKFLNASALDLPFPDNFFDKILFIAVLHHIPSVALRQKALKEIYRVLKPGGFIFIMNWHYSSPKFRSKLAKFTLAKIIGKSELDFGDVYIGWGNTEIKRYVHIFTKTEMKKLLKSAGFKVVKNYTSEHSKRGFRNIVTIAKKC